MNHPLRVLICEDSRIVGRVLSCIVEQCGHVVDAVVRDGEAAVERAEASHPDLVLMDVGLPGINGIDAAKLIKQSLPSTRVILVTGSHQSIQQALQARVDGICSKNVLGYQLKAALKASEDGKCWLDMRVARPIDANSICLN